MFSTATDILSYEIGKVGMNERYIGRANCLSRFVVVETLSTTEPKRQTEDLDAAVETLDAEATLSVHNEEQMEGILIENSDEIQLIVWSKGPKALVPACRLQAQEDPSRDPTALIKVKKADAKSLAHLIHKFMDSANIPMTKILNFTSDSDNVMLGKYNGVAAILGMKYGICHLIDFHCVAHRKVLALKDVLNGLRKPILDYKFVLSLMIFKDILHPLNRLMLRLQSDVVHPFDMKD
uniref:Uncharacterized protein n=1 Tax=Romanomermis culicivorax TaxID=13658 RepID=A0A915HD70_ROMCU